MISSDDESTSTLSEKQCSQSKCKTIPPPGSKYKTCEKCRNSSKLCTQRKRKRQKREEEEHRGSCWQVHLQETAEKGRVGDQNITYIVIDSNHEKSSEEDEVSITVVCIKSSGDTFQKGVCPCFCVPQRLYSLSSPVSNLSCFDHKVFSKTATWSMPRRNHAINLLWRWWVLCHYFDSSTSECPRFEVVSMGKRRKWCLGAAGEPKPITGCTIGQGAIWNGSRVWVGREDRTMRKGVRIKADFRWWGSMHIPLVDAQHHRFDVWGLMVSEAINFNCSSKLSAEHRYHRIHDLNAMGKA